MCQTSGWLCNLPEVRKRERSSHGSPSVDRVSTDAKYTEGFAFSKFHTNIQQYLHLCNKGKRSASRQGLPLQRAVELLAPGLHCRELPAALSPGQPARRLLSRPALLLGPVPARPAHGFGSVRSPRVELCRPGSPRLPCLWPLALVTGLRGPEPPGQLSALCLDLQSCQSRGYHCSPMGPPPPGPASLTGQGTPLGSKVQEHNDTAQRPGRR